MASVPFSLVHTQIIHLEWYSVTRDCLFYSVSVVLLIWALGDEKIFWYEALVFVSVYGLYIIGENSI